MELGMDHGDLPGICSTTDALYVGRIAEWTEKSSSPLLLLCESWRDRKTGGRLVMPMEGIRWRFDVMLLAGRFVTVSCSRFNVQCSL